MFFLIFLIVRDSSAPRALTLTLILSLSLDIIFQTGRIKGLACMGQLGLVYLVTVFRKQVNPLYEDLFLLIFFALFYIVNYYFYAGLSILFGVYFDPVHPANLLFRSLFHTALFSLLLFLQLRFERRSS